MKARLIRFLKSLINKGRIVEKEQCVVCKGSNDFYRINFKVYCSLNCYHEYDLKSKNVRKKKSKQKKTKR